MHNDYFLFKSSRIHYSCWGNGPEIRIGIPGYGESSGSFECLSRQIPQDQYLLISMDLPCHGLTEWNEGLQFSVTDLIGIIDGILAVLDRTGKSFKLIGFSLGGRIALSLVEKMPERIDKLVLIAPDGLVMSAWYWLATQNKPGSRLFRFSITHAGWIFAVLKVGKFCRIIQPEFFKIATHYIQDKAERENLYRRWTVLRNFKPDLKAIKACILKNNIQLELLLGEYDPLIQIEKGERFRRGIEQNCRITLIKGGHQLLQEKYATLVHSLLKD